MHVGIAATGLNSFEVRGRNTDNSEGLPALRQVTREGVVVASGDVNGDGKVNVADVTMLAALISSGTPPVAAVGDINGDGVVNWADVQALAEMIVSRQ